MEIGVNTAVGITKALPNFILAALTGALGAVQLATVLATPIPKYEFGTRGGKHKGGLAEVAEKRPEVILEPNRNPYIIEKRGVYNLPKGTEVIPSMEEYKRLQEQTALRSLRHHQYELEDYMEIKRLSETQTLKKLEQVHEELKKLNSKKQSVVVNVPKGEDIAHELWRLNNIKW